MPKIRHTALLASFTIFLLSACNSQSTGAGRTTPAQTPSHGAFVTFAEFLRSVSDATLEHYTKLPGAQVHDASAFAEMREYIHRMYAGVQQASSFVVDGQYVDCIQVESQPSVHQLGIKAIAKPPAGSAPSQPSGSEFPGEKQYAPSILTLGQKDPFGNEISCPDGTIPMQRITLEQLVTFKTVRDFLAKAPDRSGPEPTEINADLSKKRYATALQDRTNYGGNSWLNLWNPRASFSLSQQWYWAGRTPGQQTVEGGWIAWPRRFGSRAVLFIYWTADNYNSTGCYNLTCAGFVQINRRWYLGGGFSQYSTAGGIQWGFEMQWKLYAGNWWLFLKGPGNYEAVGYYPAFLYGAGPLSRFAFGMEYGGETDNSAGGAFPPMGSGQFATTGFGQAAFQDTIFYIARDENDGVGVWATLDKKEPSPRCYTVIPTTPASGEGATYFFFGGPGGVSC